MLYWIKWPKLLTLMEFCKEALSFLWFLSTFSCYVLISETEEMFLGNFLFRINGHICLNELWAKLKASTSGKQLFSDWKSLSRLLLLRLLVQHRHEGSIGLLSNVASFKHLIYGHDGSVRLRDKVLLLHQFLFELLNSETQLSALPLFECLSFFLGKDFRFRPAKIISPEEKTSGSTSSYSAQQNRTEND